MNEDPETIEGSDDPPFDLTALLSADDPDDADPPAGDGDPPASEAVDVQDLIDKTTASVIAGLRTAQPDPAPDQGDDDLDPVRLARLSIKLESSMVNEAKQRYPDMPAEGLAEIEEWISGFADAAQLQQAKAQGLHHVWSDHVAEKLRRSGKYQSAARKTVPAAEPYGLEPVNPNLGSQRALVASMEKQLGVKFTAEDLAEAQRLSQGGM